MSHSSTYPSNLDQAKSIAPVILGIIAIFAVVPGMLYMDHRNTQQHQKDLRAAIERTDAKTVISHRHWGVGSGQLSYRTCAKVDGERDCIYGAVEVPDSVYSSYAVGDVIAEKDMDQYDLRDLRG